MSLGRLLACSINIRGMTRGAYTPHHMKTLAVTSSSRPKPEALVACEVLAHPHAPFHIPVCVDSVEAMLQLLLR
jgi:hypothetical protein